MVADAGRQGPTLNELACRIEQLDISEEDKKQRENMQTKKEDEQQDDSWACLAMEHSMWEREVRAAARTWSPTTRRKFGIGDHTITSAPKNSSTRTSAAREASEEMLNQLRRDHGDAKAVKSDGGVPRGSKQA
jgi:hypothetical protein